MEKRKSLMPFITVVFVLLIPSVALAGPLEQLQEGGMSIWHSMLEPLLGPYRDIKTWGWPLSIACSALTIVGLIRIHPISAKIVGGFGGFLQLPIAIAVAWMIFGMAKGIFLGAIRGILSQYLWGWLVDGLMFIVGIAFVWGLLKYLMGNASGIFQNLISFVKSQVVPPLQGNANMGHMILGGILVSGGINQHWVGSLLGCALGIYTILFVETKIGTVVVQNQLDKTKAKVLHKPLDDGRWYCPNFAVDTLMLGGKPILDKESKPKTKKRHCGHLNPPEADRCMSKTCDHPNPYTPWECPGCKYKGEDKKGITWDTAKCPKCATLQPARPEATPFHIAGQDQYHAGISGAPAPVAQPAPTTAQRTCPHCHTANEPHAAFCKDCGKSMVNLHAPQPAQTAPVVPQPVVAPPPAPQPRETKDSVEDLFL